MKHLNQKTTKIFDGIIDKLNGDDHLKIDNGGACIMPLVVEKLQTHDIGTVYSLAHYFEQNGDLCQDPEMLFLKHTSGQVYPMMFQMAIPPVYEESIFLDDGWKCLPRKQAEHARFANTWLVNIKDQQGL